MTCTECPQDRGVGVLLTRWRRLWGFYPQDGGVGVLPTRWLIGVPISEAARSWSCDNVDCSTMRTNASIIHKRSRWGPSSSEQPNFRKDRRMANYVLLLWLVETPSRDISHYWMLNVSTVDGLTFLNNWTADRFNYSKIQKCWTVTWPCT